MPRLGTIIRLAFEAARMAWPELSGAVAALVLLVFLAVPAPAIAVILIYLSIKFWVKGVKMSASDRLHVSTMVALALLPIALIVVAAYHLSLIADSGGIVSASLAAIVYGALLQPSLQALRLADTYAYLRLGGRGAPRGRTYLDLSCRIA